MAFFQDDIIIYSSTFEQHLSHIQQVFHRLQNSNLTANPAKTFLYKEVNEAWDDYRISRVQSISQL